MDEFNHNEEFEKSHERDNNFETDYKMLLYFQDEYKYRHKHFWSTIKMFFILNIAISLLPFISGIINLEINFVKFPIYIFPIVGVCIAIVSFVFLMSEVKTFNLVAQKKYKINELLSEKYHYKRPTDNSKNTKRGMSFKIILTNLIFQIIVAVGSLIVCLI